MSKIPKHMMRNRGVARKVQAPSTDAPNRPEVFTFKPTTNVRFVNGPRHPHIYMPDALDPEYLELAEHKRRAIDIFECTQARFVPPSEFNYEPPKGNVPEFAFVGRSNVGKSSLIRALLGESTSNKEKIVRVSATPGCTTSVNYYSLFKPNQGAAKRINQLSKSGQPVYTQHNTSPMIYLVDLPGYGFARAAKTDRAKWKQMIFDFLATRHMTVMRRVYVLVDARRGIKEEDYEMLKILGEAQFSNQVILTKCDDLKPADLHKALQSVFNVTCNLTLNPCMPYVHTVSALSGMGIDDLKLSMAEIANQNWGDPTKVHSPAEIKQMAKDLVKEHPEALNAKIETEEGIVVTPAMEAMAKQWKIDFTKDDEDDKDNKSSNKKPANPNPRHPPHHTNLNITPVPPPLFTPSIVSDAHKSNEVDPAAMMPAGFGVLLPDDQI